MPAPSFGRLRNVVSAGTLCGIRFRGAGRLEVQIRSEVESFFKGLVMKSAKLVLLGVFALIAALPDPVVGQDSRASEIIELNRRMMHQQIIEGDATLFGEISIEGFLVVAPGGRIENKMQAMGGAPAWDVNSIDVRDEQVIFHGNTAVLVGRLQIDGIMRPVGELPPMKFMAVFVESGNEWKLMARSLTPCFEMAIERGFC